MTTHTHRISPAARRVSTRLALPLLLLALALPAGGAAPCFADDGTGSGSGTGGEPAVAGAAAASVETATLTTPTTPDFTGVGAPLGDQSGAPTADELALVRGWVDFLLKSGEAAVPARYSAEVPFSSM